MQEDTINILEPSPKGFYCYYAGREESNIRPPYLKGNLNKTYLHCYYYTGREESNIQIGLI
jgi:hypothetical protein